MHFKPYNVIRFDFQEKNLRGWIQKRGESGGRETYMESKENEQAGSAPRDILNVLSVSYC